MNFLDLHSHILPGLDDGSPNLETSLQMIQGLTNIGFSTICATPHQKTGQYLPSLEEIKQAHEQVVQALNSQGIETIIPLAAENMWDSTLYDRMESEEIPTYTGTNVFLMEFIPSQLPVGVFERIFQLKSKGMLPVVAHPERYSFLWKSPDTTDKFASNCAMVVDLGALAGDHGRKLAKYSRKLVLDGVAHAAASDAHTVKDVESARKGIAWIAKKLGDQAVTRLMATNPAKILAGELPDP